MSEAREFAKLDASFPDSSIWFQPDHVLRVWLVFICKRNYRTGILKKTILALARDANKTVAETEDALKVLLSPDPYSRTPDNDGRRIEVVEGGWRILNHGVYYNLAANDQERERKREWAAKNRERLHVDVSDDDPSTSSEVDALRDLPSTSTPDLKSDPDPEEQAPGQLKPSKRERAAAAAPSGMPVLRYKFRADWKPKKRHRVKGAELGLSEEAILTRADDCRLKVYRHGFDDEDDQFERELTWLKNDLETKRFKEMQIANRRDFEQPGHDRG